MKSIEERALELYHDHLYDNSLSKDGNKIFQLIQEDLRQAYIKGRKENEELRKAAKKVVSFRFEGTNDSTNLYDAICQLEQALNQD